MPFVRERRDRALPKPSNWPLSSSGLVGLPGCTPAARTLKAVSAGHSAGRRSGGTPVVAQRAASTNHLHARTSTQ